MENIKKIKLVMDKLYPEVNYKVTYNVGDVCSLNLTNVVVIYDSLSARPYYYATVKNEIKRIGHFGCISRDFKNLVNLKSFITTDFL
jgi:hypothetical protein